MPNPFPGMDPWLEQHWSDVHTRLVTYASDQIAPQLPRDLRARVQEHINVIEDEVLTRRYEPDVLVRESEGYTSPSRAVGSATAVATPVLVPLIGGGRARDLRIVDTSSGNRVVTVIEFVSPANKAGSSHRPTYCRKHRDLFEAHVSVVEIDLLRGGRYVPALPELELPPKVRKTYHVCMVRATHPERAEVYPLDLRERLPAISVPLRAEDPDVVLDLQSLLDLAYDRAGYDDINYDIPPDPPLNPDDAQWAAEVLARRR